MSQISIVNIDGCLTDESTKEILQHTEVLECACPRHLLDVLKSIRDFQEYETGCIIRYPKDQEVHSWLLEESKSLEVALTKTIIELMKKEQIIDDQLNFCIPPRL